MDFDVPSDLISKSQIGFRQGAGLSSFDPTDSTLPSLPTVEASISTVEPSPSYLRCKYCQGKLLRGLQSLICIYCGEFQKKDLHPDPISFNSTIGYSWLLQSLYFNGSERVGSLSEGIGITGGQSPAEDEATLSELLDLKILWRDQPKKPKNNFNIRNSERNNSLNRDSDFDNFFIKSKRDIVSNVPEEQPIASKNDQNKAFEDQENLKSVTSAIDASDDTSSDWNAEFQFADNIKTENVNLESVDPFVGAEPDLSNQMDAVFGQIESFNNKKPNDDSDLFQDDDLFANVSSATVQQADQLDSDVQAKDVLSGHPNDLNSESVIGDWFSDGNWQKSSANNTITVKKDDNLFDIKPQIASDLDNINKHHSDATVQSKDDLSGNPNDPNSVSVDADWFSDGNWQKSTSNNTITAKEDNLFDIKPQIDSNLDNINKHHSDATTDWFQDVQSKDGLSSQPNDLNSESADGDWFQNTDWQKSTVNKTDTVNSKDDNLLDIKPLNDSDLVNSNKQHSDTTTDWFQDSQWAIGGSSSTTTNMVANKDDDDVFDDWNDFTSSTANQDSFQDTWKQNSNKKDTVNENMSGLNLFPSKVDSQEVDFDDFFQSDMFSGSSSNKKQNDNHEVFDIFSEVSTTSRNANPEAGNIANEPKNDEITLNATTSTKNDVQMLLSQMHDLSFMLNSELSIPSKSNDFGPSHS